MRHKYETRGLVLSRSPLGEANAHVTLLTPDLGVMRARAQGLRRPGAKLAASLTTLAESGVTLVRGKEEWRISGAVLEENWFLRLTHPGSRARAARVCGLLLRLSAREVHDPGLYPTIKEFFTALIAFSEGVHEAAEILAVLRILAALGLDEGVLPGPSLAFPPEVLEAVAKDRSKYLARVNHGIQVSGL